MTPRGEQVNLPPGGARAFAQRLALACLLLACFPPATLADRLHLKNGAVLEVDEAWEDKDGVWYRRAGVTQVIAKDRVSRIEKTSTVEASDATTMKVAPAEAVKGSAPPKAAAPLPAETVWIHLVGGAKFEVEAADETAEGVWYKRSSFSIFLDKSRVERVERAVAGAAPATAHKAFGWTTGRSQLDELIRLNGARHGVDPYLIFCVMEQESRFNPRAVSTAGARGLMQLMPGTARRFGVRNIHDPAQNVSAGTRYLKELLGLFNGRLDLVLAGYNAGEGAVMKYGRRVPPYRETKNYVKRIGDRYGKAPAAERKETGDNPPPAPGR